MIDLYDLVSYVAIGWSQTCWSVLDLKYLQKISGVAGSHHVSETPDVCWWLHRFNNAYRHPEIRSTQTLIESKQKLPIFDPVCRCHWALFAHDFRRTVPSKSPNKRATKSSWNRFWIPCDWTTWSPVWSWSCARAAPDTPGKTTQKTPSPKKVVIICLSWSNHDLISKSYELQLSMNDIFYKWPAVTMIL